MKLSDLWVKLGLKSDGFKKGVDDAEKKVSKFSSSLQNIGKVMAGAFAITTIVQWGKAAFSVVSDFDSATAQLAATLGKTTDEISDLTELSKELGRNSQFTATQVSMLANELGKLGFSNTEITNSSAAVLDLASATGTDLANSAKIAGSALRAFNLDASEMDRVSSVLAVSTTKSALSVEDFSTALSTAAPVAAKFGFEIEDVVALLGKLKDAGFDASSAGTAVRNILLNLADANGALAQELGGAVGSFDELIPAMVELRDSGIDLNKTLALTDKRSVAAFATLLSTAEGAKDLRDNLIGVNDELKDMVATKTDTLVGGMDALKSAFEGFILEVSGGEETLKSVFRTLAKDLNSVTDAIKGLKAEDGPSTLDKLRAAAQGVGGPLQSLVGVIDMVGKHFGLIEDATPTNPLESLQKTTNKSVEELSHDLEFAAGEYEKFFQRAQDLAGSEEGRIAENQAREWADVVDVIEKAIGKIKSAVESEIEPVETIIKPQVFDSAELLQTEIKKAKSELDDLYSTIGQTNDIEAFTETLKSVDDLTGKIEALQAVYDSFFNRQDTPEQIQGIGFTDLKTPETPTGLVGFSDADLAAEKEKIEEWKKQREEMIAYQKDFNMRMNATIQNGFADMFASTADGLGQLLAGESSFSDFGAGILSSIGSFMQQLGTLMITYGLGMSKFQAAISSGLFGGPLAIAAGAALVTAGAALKSIKSKTSGSSGGSNYNSSASNVESVRNNSPQDDFYLETRLRGQDFITSLQRANTTRNTTR